MPQDATVIVAEYAGSPVLEEYSLEVGDAEYREQATQGISSCRTSLASACRVNFRHRIQGGISNGGYGTVSHRRGGTGNRFEAIRVGRSRLDGGPGLRVNLPVLTARGLRPWGGSILLQCSALGKVPH